jgi:hypothetical protein
VRRFYSNVAIKAFAEDAQVADVKLHCALGGDIEFMNLVLGMMNCSSTFPCYLCEVKLETLTSPQKDIVPATARTPVRFEEQLKNVEVHKIIAK